MSGSGESSSTSLQQQQPQQQQQKGRERRKAIIERNCCQGGFCELVLSGTSDDSSSSTSNNYSGSRSSKKDMLKSLSKRERRLQKSRERDSAIRLLKWVLTEEEYSALEETGDLVRLKVKECPGDANNVVTATTANNVTTTNKCNNAAAVGCWIDGASVILAKREHRPVLARLAYVEFQSSQSLEAYSNNSTTNEGGGGDDMANFKMFNDSCEPCAVTEPSYAGNDNDVIVCRICFNVYNLLSQARDFLASIHAEEAESHNSIETAVGVVIDEKEDTEQDNNACNNQPPENETAAGNSDAIVEGGDVPPNLLTRSSSEGPHSPKWTTSSTTMVAKEPLTRSATFHGPISPSNASESKKSKRKAKRKERDRKQMEENAKIFILVAESDETTNKLAKRLLEQKGYTVESVTNGVDCFKALQSKEYAILLVNENLNGKDALSIGLWVRQNEATTAIRRQVKMRVLVVVRNILSVNYHAYEAVFVDGFLPMPLEGSKLVPSIQKAAGHYQESILLAERCKQIADANSAPGDYPPTTDAATTMKEREQAEKQIPKDTDSFGNKGPKAPSARKAPSKGLSIKRKKDPVAYESKFQYDENTSFPYTIIENRSDESTSKNPLSTTEEVQQTPWCNLIVCQDVFDTYERFKIFFLPMVSRYAGMKILLWNYPGQAFTSFTEDANLNNKYHADCLAKLLDHLKQDTGHGQFSLDQRFFILAHGSGAAIATYFAATQQLSNLKGMILVNGLSHVDSHYASVFHDCRNVFSCSPESRPDLPVYFYARFLFSPSYLSKTTSSLALNVYTAVHNPITLNGRKRLCQGVLNHVDTRPLLKDIGSPIITIHGENDALVRAIHSSEFLQGRRGCSTIPQALRGGNRTAIAMMKGGHELFQEKKYHISLLVEQILTGFHDKVRIQQRPTGDSALQELEPYDYENNFDVDVQQPAAATKQVEDNYLDKVIQEGRDGQSSSWDKYHEEIMTDQNNKQKDKNTKAAVVVVEGKKDFDPNEYPEVKEYMAWRIKRQKKRLAELDRSARIIQSALRCFMAKTMLGRIKKEKAAILIQRCTRGIFGREIYRQMKKELWAAMLVQRAVRGHSGRCTSYQKRMERRAQVNVARMMRGLFARRRFLAVCKKREYAATNIESLWRMHAAIVLRRAHRQRREASTTIQKLYRGHLGRRKAVLERDKYIFSRSQNSGIELGRQLLAEHKLHATKLQSEISLLNQEKDKMEKQIEHHLTEIANFERTVSELEKKMHNLVSKVDTQQTIAGASIASPKDAGVREEKRRMDEEFSETLVKISDRKDKLEKLEKTFEQLLRDREYKFGQLKNLEGKLAVLLDAQDAALEGIRKKQELRIDSVVSFDPVPHHSHQSPLLPMQKSPSFRSAAAPSSRNDVAAVTNNQYYSGPSEKDKMQASQLIDSTETMLKFGFMSMSLTYFSTLNMMRAMQRVAAVDTVTAAVVDGPQGTNATSTMPSLPSNNTAVRVETWSINDVSRWLTSISLSQYQSAFKEGAVDGSFLCELTDDDLRNTLGVEHRLHRKKILFSIRCLKNYADAQVSQVPPLQQSSGRSAGGTSPSSAANHDDDDKSVGNYLNPYQDRNHGSLPDSPPARSNSVLDILTPKRSNSLTPTPSTTATPKKSLILLSNFEQLRTWVRHQKYDSVREALENMPDAPFPTKHIRIQFVEEIGTAYTDQYDREPFNLNRVDEHGNTLMHIAAQTGNIRIGKLLTRKGANANHQNKQGQTPGHFACAYQFFDFASWLFDEKGAGADDLLQNIFGLGPYDGLEE